MRRRNSRSSPPHTSQSLEDCALKLRVEAATPLQSFFHHKGARFTTHSSDKRFIFQCTTCSAYPQRNLVPPVVSFIDSIALDSADGPPRYALISGSGPSAFTLRHHAVLGVPVFTCLWAWASLTDSTPRRESTAPFLSSLFFSQSNYRRVSMFLSLGPFYVSLFASSLTKKGLAAPREW